MEHRPAGRGRWVALVLAALLVAPALTPASAGPHDRLERIRAKQQRVEREQEQNAARRGTVVVTIRELDARRAEAERKVAALDAVLADLDARIVATRNELAAAQQHYALLSDRLLDIQGELVRSTDLFTGRAIVAYKAGPTAYLDAMLSSQSLGDLVDRFNYYESALNTDAQLVEQIQRLRNQTSQRRDAVEKTKDLIARKKLDLEADRRALASVRAERAEVLRQREEAVGAKRALLGLLERRRDVLRKLEQQLQSDAARVESLLANVSSGAPVGGGQLLWPASGPLTSSYGWRTHPIFGDRRFHSGIDIGAGYGSPVLAADGGSVVYVGTMSGYGNVVVIDHGGGLASTYNHLSSFYVYEGQSVTRGQRVASVGCTGYCTGPHLHFEVRVNGSPVDPMPYLQ